MISILFDVQGVPLQICLETGEDSEFKVIAVQEVTVSQDGANEFEFITDNENNLLGRSDCVGTDTADSMCKVKLQLLGLYFKDKDPANLSVTGLVKLDYVDPGDDTATRRRRLGSASLNREAIIHINMRKLDEVNAAGFDMADIVIASSMKSSPTDTPDSASPKVNGAESTSDAISFHLNYHTILLLSTFVVAAISTVIGI